MLTYHTPGVYYERTDIRPSAIGPWRTDIAGFVGIAARGPLHQPVKVESWTQFVSVFGGHIRQGYLAYAVEGFFANGGQTCWVVRVADPALAHPASLDLPDETGRPTLRLIASSPGVWGNRLTVSVVRTSTDRFSLALRLPNGEQEFWQGLTMRLGSLDLLGEDGRPVLRLNVYNPEVRDEVQDRNMTVSIGRSGEDRFSLTLRIPGGRHERWSRLTMDRSDPRYVETVLNHQKTGSRLVTARDLGSPAKPAKTPDPHAINLRAGVGQVEPDLRYVETVLNDPKTGSRLVQASDLKSPARFPKNTPNRRVARPYVDLLNTAGEPTLRLIVSRLYPPGLMATVSVEPNDKGTFALVFRSPYCREKRVDNLSMDPKDKDHYVEIVLNDLQKGFPLVTVEDLNEKADTPQATSAAHPIRLIACGWRLAGGRDGLAPSLVLRDHQGQPTLRLTASGPHYFGENLQVSVERKGKTRFNLILRTPDGGKQQFEDLSMYPTHGRYVETVINDRQAGSLVAAQDLHAPSGFPDNTPDPGASNLRDGLARLAGGLSPEHFNETGTALTQPWGLATLEAIDEVSVVAVPDIMPKPWVPVRYKREEPDCDVLEGEPALPAVPEASPEHPPFFDEGQILELQRGFICHCEQLKDRVAVLDAPPSTPDEPGEGRNPEQIVHWRNEFETKYAALYYPWLRVPDPLGLGGILRTMPPSGHIAGVYARVDQRVGVHKPPANEVLETAKDVQRVIDDVVHGSLNDRAVNALRSYNGRGVRVGGARTLSYDGSWRFVNVRRLLIMIEEAIDENTQWTVFEPNNPDLWRDIDRVVRGFLDRLWQRGMLDGATAEEAYSVRCDESTNPPQETDLGRLICEIGVLPPWPAEFVVVRIGKTESGIQELG